MSAVEEGYYGLHMHYIYRGALLNHLHKRPHSFWKQKAQWPGQSHTLACGIIGSGFECIPQPFLSFRLPRTPWKQFPREPVCVWHWLSLLHGPPYLSLQHFTDYASTYLFKPLESIFSPTNSWDNRPYKSNWQLGLEHLLSADHLLSSAGRGALDPGEAEIHRHFSTCYLRHWAPFLHLDKWTRPLPYREGIFDFQNTKQFFKNDIL